MKNVVFSMVDIFLDQDFFERHAITQARPKQYVIDKCHISVIFRIKIQTLKDIIN